MIHCKDCQQAITNKQMCHYWNIQLREEQAQKSCEGYREKKYDCHYILETEEQNIFFGIDYYGRPFIKTKTKGSDTSTHFVLEQEIVDSIIKNFSKAREIEKEKKKQKEII